VTRARRHGFTHALDGRSITRLRHIDLPIRTGHIPVPTLWSAKWTCRDTGSGVHPGMVLVRRDGQDHRMSPRTAQEPRGRWWSPALVVHAVVVLVIAVASPLLGPGTPAAVAGVISAAGLLLGMPWWLVTGFLYMLPVPPGPVSEAVIFSLPLLINLAVHAAVLQAVRATRRPSAAEGGSGATTTGRRSPGSVLAIGFLFGALTWGAWLGWDRTASYDVVTGTVQSPYVTLQVLGCALTVATVTAVLAARWHPVAGAAGVGLGFWLLWTIDAASQDDSGLFAVGSMMLAVGLALGTAVAAAVGRGVRALANAVRRWRAARADLGGREVGDS
jgi:hypothetical protein